MDEKRQVSWRLLPRKPAKLLRSTLQKHFKEVKEYPREDSIGYASLNDPDMHRSERYRHLELDIQVRVRRNKRLFLRRIYFSIDTSFIMM